MGASNDLSRLKTHDIELGVTEAAQKHVSRHIIPPPPVSQGRLNFEHSRPRWLRECVAEATGVFFYVFPGIASIASFTLNSANPLGVTAFGSLFQVGWSFAIGIAFAIITCAPTSGGHFNPAITICFAVWQGFPWKKVPYYIGSQIFGSFVAGLLMVGMYWEQLSAYNVAAMKEGLAPNSNGGAASVLCSFPAATQTNLGYLFFIEFFVDSFIGFIIWAVLDPSNPFISAAAAPWSIGLAYAVMVWGFANITISTNLARDLGTRIVAAIFFGGEAFSYHNYSWIAILVNVPATLFATAYYELFFRDSLGAVVQGHRQVEGGEEGLTRYMTNKGIYRGDEMGSGDREGTLRERGSEYGGLNPEVDMGRGRHLHDHIE